jgi:hypothetical protein
MSASRQSHRHDLAAAVAGVGIMGAALVTPFLRARRNRWGMGPAGVQRVLPGDDRVPAPAWSWTHAIEVAAPAGDVWPWVAQIGADRAGFYSYAALENMVGCGVRNAERIHPEWQDRRDTELVLHPRAPGLPVVDVAPGRHLVAYAAPDPAAVDGGRPWTAASWLLMVEPLGLSRCRVISRYRSAHSADLRTRLGFGAALLEPIGFAMDRRMLAGIRERSQRIAA